jgi:tRNA 2-(methylsulfanyl)-N6-isopentenyladenosine37 hydroxylase
VSSILELRVATRPGWVDAVLADFDAFLIDHAACERKASATGMAFVVRYPDRVALLDPLIAFAREELDHFHRVYRLLEARGVALGPDVPDPYVRGLIARVRTGRDERLLDRLLVAGVVEARGCERFGMIAKALPAGELADFYADITRSEARHHGLFLRLARAYFDEASIDARLRELLDAEARIVEQLPLRAALH